MSRLLPWEEMPHIWKTEGAFMSWLRGGIRRSLWNKSPVKLEFIKQNRTKIPNPNPKGRVKEVWGGTCAITGKVLPLDQLEVDHKTGNHSLKSLDDISEFIKGIVLVSVSDLQFVSKEAHRIKSYAEKEGLSYEEASAIKQAIAIVKSKKEKQWLEERGITPAANQASRREQIINYIKENPDD